MTEKYFDIEGLTCNGCVKKLKSILEPISGIEEVRVDLNNKEATLLFSKELEISSLQPSLGKYKLRPKNKLQLHENQNQKDTFISKYKPLFVIFGFLLLITVFVQFPFHSFDWLKWMKHFMAGFFVTFSFFKFLDLKGFSLAFSQYDIIAGKWKVWGSIFPILELLFGILFLTDSINSIVLAVLLVFLIISTIGVVQSNLRGKKIICACLGTVFNLPMSTLTIVENLLMIAMASFMLAMQ